MAGMRILLLVLGLSMGMVALGSDKTVVVGTLGDYAPWAFCGRHADHSPGDDPSGRGFRGFRRLQLGCAAGEFSRSGLHC